MSKNILKLTSIATILLASISISSADTKFSPQIQQRGAIEVLRIDPSGNIVEKRVQKPLYVNKGDFKKTVKSNKDISAKCNFKDIKRVKEGCKNSLKDKKLNMIKQRLNILKLK